jgi:hypothetical protein
MSKRFRVSELILNNKRPELLEEGKNIFIQER